MESTGTFVNTILSIVQSRVHNVANNCNENFGRDIDISLENFKRPFNGIPTELLSFFKQNVNFVDYESKILGRKLFRK